MFETISNLIEKTIDEGVAYLIIASGVYRTAVEPMIPLPEWHTAAIGVVLMFYFGRKIRQNQK